MRNHTALQDFTLYETTLYECLPMKSIGIETK